MRLLIVEDERAIAEVMMLNLKRVGYECEYAQDGEMGVAMVEKQSYDLVLLDIMLPKIRCSLILSMRMERDVTIRKSWILF